MGHSYIQCFMCCSFAHYAVIGSLVGNVTVHSCACYMNYCANLMLAALATCMQYMQFILFGVLYYYVCCIIQINTT